MNRFRLRHIRDGTVTTQNLDETCPPYLAVSHTWGESFFPPHQALASATGYALLQSAVRNRFPDVQYCWIDTLCIDQEDDADKNRQIPLMGRIFSTAVAVVIMLACEVGFGQSEVDELSASLTGLVDMVENDRWREQGAFWQVGSGRDLLVKGMDGLARLVQTSWTSRVWTLQEYILGREIMWVGTDLKPISVQDVLFSALPSACDTLVIDECLGPRHQRLFAYSSGMANCRLKKLDPTRVMELLGNRAATMVVDEVYGVMAASGVEIQSVTGEGKEAAWERWLTAAISQGHLRWIMTPASLQHLNIRKDILPSNCILPPFEGRHRLSANSQIDSIQALGASSIAKGSATVLARWVGECKLVRRLGTVLEPVPNRIHRDMTLIIMARGSWSRASALACTFGAGRYNRRQRHSICQTLCNNYWRALNAISTRREDKFVPKIYDPLDSHIWSDFMQLQMSQMVGMNDSVAYLAEIRRDGMNMPVVVPLGNTVPAADLSLDVLDLGARSPDNRIVFMVVARPPPSSSSSSYQASPAASLDKTTHLSGGGALHKVAVTLPVTDDINPLLSRLPLLQVQIGGQSCWRCSLPKGERAFEHENLVSSSTQFVDRYTVAEIKRRAFAERRASLIMKRLITEKDKPPASPNASSTEGAKAMARRRRSIKYRKTVWLVHLMKSGVVSATPSRPPGSSPRPVPCARKRKLSS